MPDPVAVNTMFARIARRYDLANRVLSGGIDRWWRRRLVAAVRATGARHVLDLATGSGDVAFALSRGLPPEAAIIGMDFCEPMLDEAEIKKARAATYGNVTFRVGDALALPLAEGSLDAVTVSFGLRNMADRSIALKEMHRVLRPGGHLFVLEFSQPHAPIRPLYYAYLRQVLPRIAGRVTGDRSAYDYLGATIETFPSHQVLAAELRSAGFDPVRVARLTFGVVALHQGRKAPDAPGLS